MVCAQLRIYSREWETQRDFGMQTDHLIPAKRLDVEIFPPPKKRQENLPNRVEFAIPADHRVNLKER